MNLYSLISILAAVLVFSLGNFIFYNNPKNHLNRLVAVFCLLLAYLLFVDFGLNQSTTLADAEFWVKAGCLWAFAPPLLLNIVLVFTGMMERLNSKLWYIFLYVPPLVIAILELTTSTITSGAMEVYWGWTFTIPADSTLYEVANLWSIFLIVVATYLSLKYYWKADNHNRKQAFYLIGGLIIPVIIGSLTDIILPLLGIEAPLLTNLAAVVGIGLISFTVARYKFPLLQSGLITNAITNNMPNLLLIVDKFDYIREVNPRALEILGYSYTELENHDIAVLNYDKNELTKAISSVNPSQEIEINLKKKNGEPLPLLLAISEIKNANDLSMGKLIIGTDLTEMKGMENEIRQSLRDKEILLREIHHRVKNNMQIISSLLSLQSKYMDTEAVSVLKDSQERVKTMAMIHENLYRSTSLENINMATYVQKLSNNLYHSYKENSHHIKLKLDVDDIYLNIDTAIPCGLIINELVTNSLKYAFPTKKPGNLLVKLKKIDENLELTIADDGVGLPKNFQIDNFDTLGLQLVDNLVRQLDGKLTLDQSSGVKFRINFNELIYQRRY